jgi:hypothetical protein
MVVLAAAAEEEEEALGVMAPMARTVKWRSRWK